MLEIITKNVQPLTAFKRRTPEFIAQIKESGQPMVLTVNGKVELVVLGAEQFDEVSRVVQHEDTSKHVLEKSLHAVQTRVGRKRKWDCPEEALAVFMMLIAKRVTKVIGAFGAITRSSGKTETKSVAIELDILFIANDQGGVPQKKIRDLLVIDPSSVTRILSKMEEKDEVIEVKRNPKDNVIYITEKGHERLMNDYDIFFKLVPDISRGIQESGDMSLVLDNLVQLHDNLVNLFGDLKKQVTEKTK